MIFDTDILVWYTRKHAAATRLLESVPFPERRICFISYFELLYGCRNKKQLSDAKEFLSEAFVETLPLTPEICEGARRLMDAFVLTRRPQPNDTLIASTAMSRGEVLATGNVKHFDFIPGLALRPFRP